MNKFNPKALADFMRRSGYGVKELMEELLEYIPKVSQTLVKGWIDGRCPNATNVYALCKIFDAEFSDFFLKLTKGEQEEYVVKRDVSKSKRKIKQKEFDHELVEGVNSMMNKIDRLEEMVKAPKKKVAKRMVSKKAKHKGVAA